MRGYLLSIYLSKVREGEGREVKGRVAVVGRKEREGQGQD